MEHVGTQILETERLLLRQYIITDADDMFRNWVADSEVSRFWGWKPHENIEETKAIVAVWIDAYSNLETYHWVIVLKSISQAIGYIYLSDINSEDNSVTVHYLLSPKYWNQGLMTEACTCVLNFAFTVLGAERVSTGHHVDNPASGRVLIKSGMRYVKTAYRNVPDCEKISGDYCIYELMRNDWKRT